MKKRLWLEDLRKKNKLTHQEVANHIKISRQYYGMIESGERAPSVTIAKKLGKILGFKWTLFFENECYKTLRCASEKRELSK
ncbi:helix-turn-helix transcriptional regulator [Alkalihalobacillus sp. LMS39]|uniref:helix-turn-helix transcriptional regulator n=1 Tax=Alkalihalobacillus sp. LMS39 TaxID=2924032 RepID=UPI001FB4AF8F|nr:helix-turn-helix transcriptional regulator [Alkalihalobacillus sp. LMS39]UOE96048.1 helix-turn-helix domain-containing protein [Alkalihalobacillus sp. LMS39]